MINLSSNSKTFVRDTVVGIDVLRARPSSLVVLSLDELRAVRVLGFGLAKYLLPTLFTHAWTDPPYLTVVSRSVAHSSKQELH